MYYDQGPLPAPKWPTMPQPGGFTQSSNGLGVPMNPAPGGMPKPAKTMSAPLMGQIGSFRPTQQQFQGMMAGQGMLPGVTPGRYMPPMSQMQQPMMPQFSYVGGGAVGQRPGTKGNLFNASSLYSQGPFGYGGQQGVFRSGFQGYNQNPYLPIIPDAYR